MYLKVVKHEMTILIDILSRRHVITVYMYRVLKKHNRVVSLSQSILIMY